MPVPGAVTETSHLDHRHIEFHSASETISGFLATPKSGGNGHGIVVLHDAFGLSPHYEDIARRFANVGYNALVPNLYHRVGGIKDIEDRTEVFGKAFGLDDRLIIQDVAAATAVLRGLPGASGKVGAIGFCAGGRQVLLVACSTDQLNAGIDCWGGGIHRASPTEDTTPLRPVKPIDLVQYLSCPLFVVIGATDQDPSPEIGQELWSRMQAHNKPGKLKVYPDAGHAFFADYRPAAYREAQAHELWNDALAFFEETLNR